MPQPSDIQQSLKRLPQVDRLLLHPKLATLRERYPELLTDFARQAVAEVRERLINGENLRRPDLIALNLTLKKLEYCIAPQIKSVINATGIILHTGLGRAPLSRNAQENLARIASGYSNVEYNLETGKRGQRLDLVDSYICQLTGAELSAVVNNNAAAVLLALNSLAFRREVIVSRGELVEIGGSFRIPEVMKKAGCRLVEVGTTNKTRLEDFAEAISPRTGAILKVHTSNYKVLGFTEEVAIGELVRLGEERKIPVIADLGGGVLLDLRQWGLPYEPVAREYIEAGVDLVTFSGDKVLGGPQCGILAGKEWAVKKCRKNHLMRALRVDKLILAVLEATLKSYFSPASLTEEVPALRMLAEKAASVKQRAEIFLARLLAENPPRLELAELRPSQAQAGSGALPLEKLESFAVFLRPQGSLEGFARRLRRGNPPVIGILQGGELALDFRTIAPDETEPLLQTVLASLK